MMRPPLSNQKNEQSDFSLEVEYNHYLPKYEKIMQICSEYHVKKILPEFSLGKAEALLREMETDGKTNPVARYFVLKYQRESEILKAHNQKNFEIIKIKAKLHKWKSDFKTQLKHGQCDEKSSLSLLSLGLMEVYPLSPGPRYRDLASGFFLTAILLDFDTNNLLIKDILKSMDFFESSVEVDNDPVATMARIRVYKSVILKNVTQYTIDPELQSFFLEHVKSEPLRIKITDHFRTILSPEEKPALPALSPSTSGLFAQKPAVKSPIEKLEEEILQMKLILAAKETELTIRKYDAKRNTPGK